MTPKNSIQIPLIDTLQQPNIKGCLIYSRVSTSRQAEEGYSLNEQERSCRKLAQQKGFQVLKVYREEGASGTTMARPQFQELLAQCSGDKRVNAVLIIHTDRLARNTLEHLTIRSLLKRYNVELISALQPMLDDSPEGNLMDIVLAGVNEFYSRDLGRKIAKGMLQKVTEGWLPIRAPFGYRGVLNPQTGQKEIEPDPTNSYYVIEAFQRFKTGTYSVKAIIDQLYEEGFRTLIGRKPVQSVVIRMLRNIFYTGKISYLNKIYPGKHRPLIDIETYTEVQRVLKLHNQGADRTRKHNFLLNGLLYCATCKSQMTGEQHIKKSGLAFRYYRCLGAKDKGSACREGFASMGMIHRQIKSWLKGVTLSERYTKALKLALETIILTQSQTDQRLIKAMENRRQAIENKMSRLEDYLLEGIIEEDRLTVKYGQLKGELKSVNQELSRAKNPKDKLTREDIDQMVKFLSNLESIYRGLNKMQKKQFLKALVSRIWIKDRKINKIAYTDTFRMIIEKDLVRISTEWWTLRDTIRTLENLYLKEYYQ
jgi:DNA invertase Pin-like site-specific DNA recombinase